MKMFEGRTPGTVAYIEVGLVTDLTDYEMIRTTTQVDVRLPHGKIIRVPHSWLMAAEETFVEGLDSSLDPDEVLGTHEAANPDGVHMPDPIVANPPPKRVVRRVVT